MSKSVEEIMLPSLKRKKAFYIPKNSMNLSQPFEEAVGALIDYLCTEDYQEKALHIKQDTQLDTPKIPQIDITDSDEIMEEETRPLIHKVDTTLQPTKTLKIVINKLTNKK